MRSVANILLQKGKPEKVICLTEQLMRGPWSISTPAVQNPPATGTSPLHAKQLQRRPADGLTFAVEM